MNVLSERIEETGSTLLTLEDGGEYVACLEYFWVKNMEDIRRIGRGELPIGGGVLYVTNIATSRPGSTDLLKLKRSLPPHRYVVGLILKHPKGVPHDFFQPSIPVSV